MTDDMQRVKKILNGTVIDHIAGGYALAVLEILGIKGQKVDSIISIAMNVNSSQFGKKDIVKIENRELTKDEVNLIALIAPQATINIIRDLKVANKMRVKIPKIIPGIVACSNPGCITNSGEPVSPVFELINQQPVILKCRYCNRYTRLKDIMSDLNGVDK